MSKHSIEERVDLDEYSWRALQVNKVFQGMWSGEINASNIDRAQVDLVRWCMSRQIVITQVGTNVSGEPTFEVGSEYVELVEGVDWVFATDMRDGIFDVYEMEHAKLAEGWLTFHEITALGELVLVTTHHPNLTRLREALGVE